ncbi:MAG: hypothetical protein NT140_06810 [Deltaproteobacteria bacterium]|nr:hypothetical protein [Deltaproteobacteria bacterium]
MRDEFPTTIKEELAKRVGFLCSNPGCRQPTSGPKSEPSGSVNIGVAAHITAASPGGPRFDDMLTSTERQSASNGIWLCQSCAKLIDSDLSKYTQGKLIEWKQDAEKAAERALEKRRSPYTESEGVFLEAERLMPELIAEMREDVRGDGSELIRELVIQPSRSVIFNSEKPRFFYVEKEHENLQLKIDWLDEMGLLIDITVGNAPIYRMVPEFIRWLRGTT